jgi:AbrB family looped-hinge helix DNA binding protein
MVKRRSAIVKVMEGGRVTIPSEIRDIENIGEGDYLEISISKIEQTKDGGERNSYTASIVTNSQSGRRRHAKKEAGSTISKSSHQ